jgi:hypothetical protein
MPTGIRTRVHNGAIAKMPDSGKARQLHPGPTAAVVSKTVFGRSATPSRQ